MQHCEINYSVSFLTKIHDLVRNVSTKHPLSSEVYRKKIFSRSLAENHDVLEDRKEKEKEEIKKKMGEEAG